MEEQGRADSGTNINGINKREERRGRRRGKPWKLANKMVGLGKVNGSNKKSWG